MKFDIVIMNPPFNRNLHLKFIDKSFDLINEKGCLINVSPHDWLTNKYGDYEKIKYKKDFRDKFANKIDNIEIFDIDKTNEMFKLKNYFGIAIYVFKHNAKGIDSKQFLSDNILVKKILNKLLEFPSISSKIVSRNKYENNDNFVPVRKTNHGYLNFVEKNYSKIKSTGGILFNSAIEKENFIKSFDTWLYKFLNLTDYGVSEWITHIPYLNDYTIEWTNERLYKLFNISDEEKHYIEEQIKNSKW